MFKMKFEYKLQNNNGIRQIKNENQKTNRFARSMNIKLRIYVFFLQHKSPLLRKALMEIFFVILSKRRLMSTKTCFSFSRTSRLFPITPSYHDFIEIIII